MAGQFAPLMETLTIATPLICAGLGVGLAFRAGLFNIGAQGQAILGAIVAAYIGFTLASATRHSPPAGHFGGLLGGAFWGGIVGWLKAKTGAHEVIVTIMMNYIAARPAGLPAHHGLPSSGPAGLTRFPPSWTPAPRTR